jgi:hypothetical protein
VMMDNLDPRDAAREEPAAPRQNPEQEQTLTDREVPLASAHTPEAIHAWLDGETVSEETLHASEKEFSFWQRVQNETGVRRRMTTPAFVPAQIMKAIEEK